jgi:Zn-dependent protease
MIRFPLFGIPVEIQPFFWVTTALLGGALRASTPDSIFAVILFMVAALISILIHELGHATVGMKYGGGRARILLTAFGGLAINEGARLHRDHRFWMIAAGPGAGFGFFIAILALLGLAFNPSDVANFAAMVLFNRPPVFQTAELVMFLRENPMVHLFIRHLLWINFWWGIINLLPVMPLDGGLIADLFVRPQRRVFLIGMVAAGAMAALGFLWMESIYTGVLFGFLAWQNYQNMQAVRWQ